MEYYVPIRSQLLFNAAELLHVVNEPVSVAGLELFWIQAGAVGAAVMEDKHQRRFKCLLAQR